MTKLLYCGFCGKSQDEVRKLIAGPEVFICDECVALCHDICTHERSEPNRVAMGEAEYLSWDFSAVRPPNPVEQLADALIEELGRRGFGIVEARFA